MGSSYIRIYPLEGAIIDYCDEQAKASSNGKDILVETPRKQVQNNRLEKGRTGIFCLAIFK